MDATHRRLGRNAGLNLVSLMDIFTILVFFLLVSSTDAESLPSTKSIKLPESIAQQKPKETLIIMVTATDIVVQGHKIQTIAAIINSNDEIIPNLKEELNHQASRSDSATTLNNPVGKEITVMSDKNIPYKLIKKIMMTCVSSKYTNISLAVLQKTKNKV
jgi:biopolymer transport protein ExbD